VECGSIHGLATVATPDATPFVYGGGVCGLIAAFAVGLPIGLVLDPTVAMLGLPLGLGCAATLHRWVRHGRLPVSLLGIAMAVLLVHLLVSGGINFAGVAGSLWLLAALALNATEINRPPPTLSRGLTIALFLAAAVLTGTCYFTAYHPVVTRHRFALQAENLLQRAVEERESGRTDLARESLARAESSFRDAAAADPFDARLPIRLAQAHLYRYLDRRSADTSDRDYQRFEQYEDQAVRLRRHSSKIQTRVGYMYLEVFQKTGNRVHVEKARQAFTTAVDLYPNSNMARARLAWVHHLAGEREEAVEQAGEALRLDALNPHIEQKLAGRGLFDDLIGPQQRQRMTLAPQDATAEQLMRRLRLTN